MKFFRPFLFISLTALLSACSLAADITPPPGYQPPPGSQATLEPSTGLLYPLVPPDPAKGEPIYAEKCAPCHGVAGLGDGPQAMDLPNSVIPIGTPEVAREAAPAEWFTIVTEGNLERFMPPFQSLSDRQRWDVVAYSLSLSNAPQSLLQSADLYNEQCAACHGESGQGNGFEAAELSVADFTNQEYMAGKSATDLFQVITEGALGGMPSFGDQLSEDQRWALADYLRSFSFAASKVVAGTEESLDSSAATQLPDVLPAEEATPTGESVADASLNLAPGSGIVSGTVINASGGNIPAGLEVFLHAFDHMQVALTRTTTLGEDGSFLFEEIEMSEGRAFLVTLEFDGATYGSEVSVVENDQTHLEVPLQVYESTSDASNLKVDRLHFFFEFLDENTLRVVELYIISNLGPKTLIAPADDQLVLNFTLPVQAANLEFQEGALGDRYLSTVDGFGDTLPIRPGMGNYQVLFSYEMPYSRKLDLVRPVNMDTNAVVILLPDDGLNVKGENIQDAGMRDVQGVQYRMFNGGSLTSGDEFSLTITGRAASANPGLSSGSSSTLLIGLGALGVALIIAGVWLYRRNQSPKDESLQPPASLASLPSKDEVTIMDAILALDDLYQEGELPEDAYLKRRQELKDQFDEALGRGS